MMVSTIELTERPAEQQLAPVLKQRIDFLGGNEAAAVAARDIGFHVMGYFPITPSTEVAENLAKMEADHEHDIVLIPGDGEHGAAGICYGAALGGRQGYERHVLAGAFVCARTVAGTGRHPHADGSERGHPHGFRPVGHPLRPF